MKVPLIIHAARMELAKEIAFVKPFEELKETLQRLKQWECPMGILTTNSAQNVRNFLSHHDLDFFDFIHVTSRFQQKDVQLKRIKQNNKFANRSIFYIGDETRDIESARKAGVVAVAVTWGYNSMPILKSHNPDHLVTKPQQLLNIL
jgi:phosphoglycolate phosphatase